MHTTIYDFLTFGSWRHEPGRPKVMQNNIADNTNMRRLMRSNPQMPNDMQCREFAITSNK